MGIKKNISLHTLCFLVLLYPLIFYVSNNLKSFSYSDISISLVLLLFINGLFLFSMYLVCRKLFKLNQEFVINLIFGVLLLIFLTMMRHVLFDNPELEYLSHLKNYSIYSKYGIYLFFAIIFFGLGFFLFNRQKQMWIILFLILNLLNISKILALEYKNYVAITLHNRNINTRLINKKNVYFILTDSLTNISGLKRLGIENHEFLHELSNMGFTHYPNFYTSLQATAFAMFTYFNLSYQYKGKNAYLVDSTIRYRHILGNGTLYEIFKKNGYKINILHELDFFLLDTCVADHCFFNISNKLPTTMKDKASKILSIISFLSPINVSALFKVEKKILFFDPHEITSKEKNMFIAKVTTELQQLDLNYPNFTYIHAFSFPTHSPMKNAEQCDEKKELIKYNHRIQKTAFLIKNIIHSIQERDKNPIIIIAGDHGPYIFRHCTREGIQNSKDVLERQGAFLSILWDKEYDGRYDQEIKSSHNLFRYVLSYLAHNEDLIHDADKDNAFTLYKDATIAETVNQGKLNDQLNKFS